MFMLKIYNVCATLTYTNFRMNFPLIDRSQKVYFLEDIQADILAI